jgi:hypothetical protein
LEQVVQLPLQSTVIEFTDVDEAVAINAPVLVYAFIIKLEYVYGPVDGLYKPYVNSIDIYYDKSYNI